MHPIRALLVAGAVLTAAGFLACGGDSGDSTTPTTTPPVTTPPVTLPPTSPGDCSPTPPPLYRIIVTVQSSDGHTRTLKAVPHVPNTDGYCDRVGYGAYKECEVRRPGDPQRAACEGLALGQAGDTGRWGPLWKYSLSFETAHLCVGGDPGCSNHTSDQYQVIARGTGEFFACANPAVPLSIDPLYPGSRCTRCWIKF